MKEVKRKWDSFLSKDKKDNCVSKIITFFKEERGEEIGIIAAEDFLNFMLQEIGEDIYNKGIDDAKTLLKSKIEDIEVELDLMLNK